ncbi:MAG: winged helix-turn-helix domain-containing protein [Candidatus Bathyarchaeia archaeon]
MVKYRRKIEIVADIVSSVASGATKKTRIMYAANLSHALLEKYLNGIISLGLLRLGEVGYEVTEKGFIFLEKYESFMTKFSKIQREMETAILERKNLENMCSPLTSNKRRRRGQAAKLH